MGIPVAWSSKPSQLRQCRKIRKARQDKKWFFSMKMTKGRKKIGCCGQTTAWMEILSPTRTGWSGASRRRTGGSGRGSSWMRERPFGARKSKKSKSFYFVISKRLRNLQGQRCSESQDMEPLLETLEKRDLLSIR